MLSSKILMSTIFLWFSTFFGCRLCTRLVFSPSFLLLFKNKTVLDLEFYWPPKLRFDPFLLETCHIVIELLIVHVFSLPSLTMFYFRERFFLYKILFSFSCCNSFVTVLKALFSVFRVYLYCLSGSIICFTDMIISSFMLTLRTSNHMFGRAIWD